jgi:hypothetical protein
LGDERAKGLGFPEEREVLIVKKLLMRFMMAWSCVVSLFSVAIIPSYPAGSVESRVEIIELSLLICCWRV